MKYEAAMAILASFRQSFWTLRLPTHFVSVSRVSLRMEPRLQISRVSRSGRPLIFTAVDIWTQTSVAGALTRACSLNVCGPVKARRSLQDVDLLLPVVDENWIRYVLRDENVRWNRAASWKRESWEVGCDGEAALVVLELTHYVGEGWVVTPVVAPLFEAFRAIIQAVYHGLVAVAKSALLAEYLFPTKEVCGGWKNVDGGAHEEAQVALGEVVHDGPEEWVLFPSSDDVRELALHLELGEVRKGFLRVVFEDLLLRKFRLFLYWGWAFKGLANPLECSRRSDCGLRLSLVVFFASEGCSESVLNALIWVQSHSSVRCRFCRSRKWERSMGYWRHGGCAVPPQLRLGGVSTTFWGERRVSRSSAFRWDCSRWWIVSAKFRDGIRCLS